jgi:hypothetical protein
MPFDDLLLFMFEWLLCITTIELIILGFLIKPL